jgi:hypothetical protein
VLQNKSVRALQIDGVPVAEAQWGGGELDSAMNIIGYDWKTYNQPTASYTYAQDRTYFVSDRSGNVWKLVFIGYGGSSTGTMTFTQELVSATSVDEPGASALRVFPVPVTSGVLHILSDEELRGARVELVDASGRSIRTTTLADQRSGSFATVDMNGMPAGIYLVRLQSPGVLRTARVVVE